MIDQKNNYKAIQSALNLIENLPFLLPSIFRTHLNHYHYFHESIFMLRSFLFRKSIPGSLLTSFDEFSTSFRWLSVIAVSAKNAERNLKFYLVVWLNKFCLKRTYSDNIFYITLVCFKSSLNDSFDELCWYPTSYKAVPFYQLPQQELFSFELSQTSRDTSSSANI